MSEFSDDFFEVFLPSQNIAFNNCSNSLSVDLGSGTSPANPFNASVAKGVDIVEAANVIRVDLFFEDLPFEDESINYITAFDFFEHVPRVICADNKTSFRFVELMSDLHRVLKPGGYIFSHTPAFPSPAVFQDPTHVNFLTAITFPEYFCRRPNKHLPMRKGRPGAARYGFQGEFIFCCQKMYATHLLTLLQKPSD